MDNNNQEETTVLQVQQIFCNNFAYNEKIVWNCYYENQKTALIEQINKIFDVTELKTNTRIFLNKNLEYLDEKQQKNDLKRKFVNLIIEAIWNQRKFNDNAILMTTIFITCIDYTTLTAPTLEKCCAATKYSIHPVFRIRKCRKNNDSTGCCMIFVDEHARVYQNWNEFKNNNLLPKSYAFSPQNGIYNNDENNDVKLELFLPPSAQTLGILSNVANKTASAGQIGAGVVLIGTLPFTAPVAASAAVCAGFVGLVCGAYKAGTGLNTLYDMNKHEEKINVENTKARRSMFDFFGGLTSVTYGTATKLFGATLKTGSAGASNIISGATSLMNEFGTGNRIFEFIFAYKNSSSIAELEVSQVASSLSFLTHSVVSLPSASAIMSYYQDKTINDLRSDLSQNNKKIYAKMLKESIRIFDGDTNNNDLIRMLSNIPDKQQFFRNVYKIDKNIDKNKMLELQQKINTETALQVFSDGPNKNLTLYVKATATNLLQVCSSFDINNLRNSVINIAETITIEACNLFFNFIEDFLRTEKSSIELLLQRFIPLENYILDIFYVFLKLTGNSFISDYILKNIQNRSFLYAAIYNFYDNLRTRGNLSVNCKICKGNYYTK